MCSAYMWFMRVRAGVCLGMRVCMRVYMCVHVHACIHTYISNTLDALCSYHFLKYFVCGRIKQLVMCATSSKQRAQHSN